VKKDENREELERNLAKLQTEFQERQSSIPIHSIRPHQLIEIEELEEQIEDLKRRLKVGQSDSWP